MDWGKEMLKWIVKYRTRHTDQNPVQSSVKPNFLISAMPEEAPLSPEESFEPIMNDLTEKVLPGLTGWESSKHFFAYFKPHSSYPAVIAELLCAGVNQMGFDWVASPACTEMEIVTLDWLAKFLNLPDKFLMSNKKSPGGGVIQGSAGESATVVLLAAIAKTKKRLALKNLERGKCVVYCKNNIFFLIHLLITITLTLTVTLLYDSLAMIHRYRSDARDRREEYDDFGHKVTKDQNLFRKSLRVAM